MLLQFVVAGVVEICDGHDDQQEDEEPEEVPERNVGQFDPLGG